MYHDLWSIIVNVKVKLKSEEVNKVLRGKNKRHNLISFRKKISKEELKMYHQKR